MADSSSANADAAALEAAAPDAAPDAAPRRVGGGDADLSVGE
jgi:hypothetical protein